MNDVQLTERISPTKRPDEKPIGFQHWSDLLFAHWRIPVSQIRDLIPETLTIDTYDGDAWIGLVPFYMSAVRPAGFPAVPWISNFCETNLRTYVHRDGKRPGVWFFSLDAARAIPILIARGKWHLNYHWARMSLQRTGDKVCYQSERIAKSHEAESNIHAELGDEIPPYSSDADRESLEYFLAERYLLYTQKRNGDLLCGQVHHSAYPLRKATLTSFEETITKANGVACPDAPDHLLFSEGVQVDIFPLRKI